MPCSFSMTKHTAYLSIGSNLGDKERNIARAISLIDEKAGRVTRQSSLIATEPWGFESKNRFLNACVEIETALSPMPLLAATQLIERQMGRKEKTHGQYRDRIIDIDILLYDHIRLDGERLAIPHRLMWQRDFVMIPLREICDVEAVKAYYSIEMPPSTSV